jgi:hypothetical protein
MAVIRSMTSRSGNHAPAHYFMNTGSILAGRPSMGSWISYGLGSDNQNLPAFVVMADGGGMPAGGPPNWGSGFLPAGHQGTPFRPTSTPILNLEAPPEVHVVQAAHNRALIHRLNTMFAARNPGEQELAARIQTYELAARMQVHAREAVDLAGENAVTRTLYGLDDPVTEPIGRRCLLARRLVEKGVRFVQVYAGGGNAWDGHNELQKNHGDRARACDRPVAALLQDLDQRGLLSDTLVLWHTEFGRTPTSQNNSGRDHQSQGFTVWLAGAGVKGGTVYGATDETGSKVALNPVSVYDLHATILHLLGIDHTKLTFNQNGREQRLTDVHGTVIRPILA